MRVDESLLPSLPRILHELKQSNVHSLPLPPQKFCRLWKGANNSAASTVSAVDVKVRGHGQVSCKGSLPGDSALAADFMTTLKYE